MFSVHDSFPDQPADDATIWRYMDLARFISILEDQALYFASAASMSDKWEGAYGTNYVPPSKSSRYIAGALIQESMYLSCWFVSEYESAAMWDIYQREGRGVAIRTTWGHLKHSLHTKKPIHGGLVQYVDYETLNVNSANILSPYNFKRKSFAHEQEARLLLWSLAEPEMTEAEEDEDRYAPYKEDGYIVMEHFVKPGFKIPVDLLDLIQSIYIAPDAQEWIKELVEQIMARYGLTMDVIQSDLNSGPIY
ncbi:DUF2971 domain-containing protein [Cryobacterium sp. 10S3]|uniref:DUF2971 domain-containing protein n=1 Tax=Cryobacterium sp. 10S3 TaxID=3048582 RepID=UPI002AC9634A|nr:DUF2971 domain-containing protein [Cryobacterium sp. 10S3]MEB0287211.1 DUF2971 domain-containing protein [Cryobacterium sp. 10S3]WPX14166.1 DUF2971 domain-containing protein [Cryobacterium sp. 10S3]